MKDIKNNMCAKENVFIAILFLVFFPLKTQFYNATFYLFDLILNSGIISKFFTFNYLGELLGCLEIQEVSEALGPKANIYYHIVFNFLFLLSFSCGLLLIKRSKKLRPFSLFDWILLVVFSFSLFDALEFFILDLSSILKYIFEIPARWMSLIAFLLILIIAIYLCFRLFSKKVKIQILFIAFPMSLISFFLWFLYLGPFLLPVQTM